MQVYSTLLFGLEFLSLSIEIEHKDIIASVKVYGEKVGKIKVGDLRDVKVIYLSAIENIIYSVKKYVIYALAKEKKIFFYLMAKQEVGRITKELIQILEKRTGEKVRILEMGR